ncbi:proton-conducting transporter transmembrane domain-containing protein [Tateyamaria pelophila]|uniref:proton-conducting transporter transmembrane domain-containing protein n=1 Tax=Tateyamaria pelophila TaxID=328415 RepID=UPI001CC14908|nr:proton-conducting transporter membrane subunit [Tateyamaria pelophila]
MTALAHPIGILLFGIGGGFLIPLLYKIGYGWLHTGFFAALGGLTLTSIFSLIAVVQGGGEAIEILTAGAAPPISINLRFGLAEGAFSVSVNVMATLLAVAHWDHLKKNYVALLLFLILVMGINGMIMTRDLFNLFVFLEIVSIGTYGLLGLVTSRDGIQAAFKYVMATVIASTLFLLGAVLIYYVTGHLNIDFVIEAQASLIGPISGIALVMMLACLLIELKPFPANGWGLDVYETVPPALAAFLSVCASAGMLFAVYKLLPLFTDYLSLIIASTALTFLASNLIGLRQDKIQRLLGYSSVGQMALGVLALAVLTQIGAQQVIPLVVFGLFLNHLLAKAGLFCLVAAIGASDLREALGLTRRPFVAGGLALFVVAICALPPFPGFWAKWELIMQLASAERFLLIAILLAGSLMETTYLFRWFIRAVTPNPERQLPEPKLNILLPVLTMAVLLIVTGVGMAMASGADGLLIFLPLGVGAGLLVVGPLLSSRLQGIAMLVAVVGASQMLPEAYGIAGLFSHLLLAGGLIIASAGLAEKTMPPLHYPLMAVLLLSIQSVLRTQLGLTFYVAWEFITVASFFLIAQGRNALPETLRFMVFSMFAAFLIMGGYAIIAGQTGSRALIALTIATPEAMVGYALLAAGFLVKAAAIGVHIWLPPAYGEAPDNVTAILSGVVSKVGIFGLLMTAYAAAQSELNVDFTYLLACIGMATTVIGALLALCQRDLKRLLAYSSMSQLGYIVTAIALMSHLGWVTALYIVANHMMVKGILFLAAGAIILRTGTRQLDEISGLVRRMPLTFAVVAVALLSMSGLPPLMGFGGKWLLLSALMDKGWTVLVAGGILATFLGLWYMTRLLVGLFFGPAITQSREAPAMILIPQVLLVGGILVFSLFPKLLMGPVSDAIDPQFAATLVWEGQSLETIYGIWDPTPVMLTSIAAAAGLMALWWGLSKVMGKSVRARAALVLARPLPQAATPRLAQAAWGAFVHGIEVLADGTRRIYTGNGQFYVLLVLAYFLVLYFMSTFLPAS